MAAWLAIFAILLASLAPSISHAVAAARWADSLPLETICHAEPDGGALDQHAHTAPSHSQGDVDLHFEHCPFCFTHAGSFGLMPVAAIAMPLVAGTAIRPALFYRSPSPLFIWVSAQPRAPPFFS